MIGKVKKSEQKTFRDRLIHSAVNHVVLLVLLSAALFIVGLMGADIISSELIARNHLEDMEELFLELDDSANDILSDTNLQRTGFNVLNDPTDENVREFKSAYEKIKTQTDVTQNYTLLNKQSNIIASSYQDNSFSTYSMEYIRGACYRANAENSGVYRSVYYDVGEYPDTLYILPFFDRDGNLLGDAVILISGSSWNFSMSETDFDGVITDERNNVMYSSRHLFISNANKMRSGKDSGNIVTINGSTYWASIKEITDRNVVIYSLVHMNFRNTFIAGALVAVLAGILWQIIASRISREMAEQNSASIDQLVQEIRIIRKKDPAHRIKQESEDEFAEVGSQINRMLDAIDELNHKNMDLVIENNRAQINELTSQMNPHFLYNTLEVIRNLVVFDGEKAEELIEELTDLLRYSISNSKREVTLQEDMIAIEHYLHIQNTRFGERLKVNINLEPSCYDVVVPKLLIQPLLENSIKYGFQNSMELTIDVVGRVIDDGALIIEVADNGGGMDADRAAELMKDLLEHKNEADSIGLRNLSKRIYLRYGSRSGIWIDNREGVGFKVTVKIQSS